MVHGALRGDEGGSDVSLCSIRMGTAVYCIETGKVCEVLEFSGRALQTGSGVATELRRVPLAPIYVAGVMSYRGEMLTTLSLRALLGREERREGGRVMVLSDEEAGERLGLLVDEVAGVVTVRRTALEANPPTLDARSSALFHGVYKLETGLMVRIDPARLRPGRLAATGLYRAWQGDRRNREQEAGCAH